MSRRPLAALASVALTGMGLLFLLPRLRLLPARAVRSPHSASYLDHRPCSPVRWWTSRGIRRTQLLPAAGPIRHTPDGAALVLTGCPFVSPRRGRVHSGKPWR